jgi:hypothetical protein
MIRLRLMAVEVPYEVLNGKIMLAHVLSVPATAALLNISLGTKLAPQAGPKKRFGGSH